MNIPTVKLRRLYTTNLLPVVRKKKPDKISRQAPEEVGYGIRRDKKQVSNKNLMNVSIQTLAADKGNKRDPIVKILSKLFLR